MMAMKEEMAKNFAKIGKRQGRPAYRTPSHFRFKSKARTNRANTERLKHNKTFQHSQECWNVLDVMKKILTLVMIYDDTRVLLGMKKQGFGAGKFNGFGGKVHAGETIEEAAMRELKEEIGIVAEDMRKRGILHFRGEEAELLEMHVFSASKFEGEPKESEEMAPEWFARDSIPFEKMWPDDKFWFPFLLAEKNFQGDFLFRGHDEILSHRVVETATFDDFKKLDLRVAKIVLAERVTGSEKLLRLKLDLGNGEIRQIVAGIGRVHVPEDLSGREIVIVSNLEPRSLMGLESQGMLLAADSEEGPVLLIPEREVPFGTGVK